MLWLNNPCSTPFPPLPPLSEAQAFVQPSLPPAKSPKAPAQLWPVSRLEDSARAQGIVRLHSRASTYGKGTLS